MHHDYILLTTLYSCLKKFDAVLNIPREEFQRTRFNRQFFIKVLLGASETTLKSSPEFQAFSEGINLYLTPAIPSFKDVSHSHNLKEVRI